MGCEMKLVIQTIGKYKYARYPGKSYRDGKQIKKQKSIYIGRVIDEQNNVFYSKEKGVFTYDIETQTYGKADPKYIGLLEIDGRKKNKLILDFGDAYFVDTLLTNIGYDKVLENIGYQNLDTLKAMLMYYILSNCANNHALTWLEGSFASIIYPNADLHSQRISNFLEYLGNEEIRRRYFDSHIQWRNENVCNDSAVLIDSTGLPNKIKINITQISNHNGKISNETRMITAVQRDTWLPLMFRVVPGNIVDINTLTRTILILNEHNVKVDMVLLDAGYYSNDNVDQLYDNKIEFVTRLPERNSLLYDEIVKENYDSLKKQENLIDFNGRFVYIKQVECKIGKDKHIAYAYLGYDVDRACDEQHKIIRKGLKQKITLENIHNIIQSSGIFIIISSLPFKTEEILPVYYNRQLVEQYFDVSKGISKLTPLRGHQELTVMGHLLLCQMAATINVYIQNEMKQFYDNREEMFMALHNQKCCVYDSKIVTYESQSQANKYYDKFKIDCPIYIERACGKLIQHHNLSSEM